MSSLRSSARALAIPAAAVLALAATATPAHAHVTVSATTAAAGSYSVLTVSVPHGCDGSATTRVAIQIPDSIVKVTPTRNPFYTVSVVTKKLDQPITDSHGNQITERDATVVYTARTPLPDGQRDVFELSLRLPDQPGATLAFPAVQTCQKGETAWTEVAQGQDADNLEHPAPTLTLTAAEGNGHATPEAGRSASASPVAVPATNGSDSGGNLLGGLGLAAGVLGLILGGTALVLVRRSN